MWFQYRAKRADGVSENGYLTAKNLEEAKKQLSNKYIAIFELKHQDPKKDPALRPVRVKPEVLVSFYRRLPTMLGAGLALSACLEFLADSESEPEFARGIAVISRGVQEGQKLSVAMSHPTVAHLFPKVVLGLVTLGENTGALVDSLERVADLSESQLRLRREVVAALTYPAFLFAGILAMTAFFVLVLAPGDKSLFGALGGEVPWPTQLLIAAGGFLRNPFLLLVALGSLAGLVWGFLNRYRNNSRWRYQVDLRLLNLPVAGTLIRKTVSAQMLYVISTALQVGMSTTQSLQLARDVCTNEALRDRFEKALRAFKDGEDLSDVLQEQQVFPLMVTSMVRMGLEVGSLETVLQRISQLYEEDVSQSLATATQLAEPILLGFAGCMSAFLALATLLPIINVVNTL